MKMTSVFKYISDASLFHRQISYHQSIDWTPCVSCVAFLELSLLMSWKHSAQTALWGKALMIALQSLCRPDRMEVSLVLKCFRFSATHSWLWPCHEALTLLTWFCCSEVHTGFSRQQSISTWITLSFHTDVVSAATLHRMSISFGYCHKLAIENCYKISFTWKGPNLSNFNSCVC